MIWDFETAFVGLSVSIAHELRRFSFSASHAGPDPATSRARLLKSTGFRVKPGMTKIKVYYS